MSDQPQLNLAITIAQRFKLFKDHKIPLTQLEQKLETNSKTGISNQQAQNRLLKYGPNLIQKPKVGVIFLGRQLRTSFSLSLWVLCGIYAIWSCIFHEVKYVKLVFTAVSTLILIIAFANYTRTNRKQAKLSKDSASLKITVIREGVGQIVETSKLVIGDLVRVKAGDIIPADLRIVQSEGMKVNYSQITGEAQDLSRSTKCTDDNLIQSANIALASTVCTQGVGNGVVVSTGDGTLIGVVTALQSAMESDSNQYDFFKFKAKTKNTLKTLLNVLTIIAIFLYWLRNKLGDKLITYIIRSQSGESASISDVSL